MSFSSSHTRIIHDVFVTAMNTNVASKKQCVTCNKSGGILICDGCQQAFCGKHVSEHRQQLGLELDRIMQEHDSFQHELNKPSTKKNPILNKIDKWEKDSIVRIQTAAENARKALQELLGSSKERLTKVSQEVAENLRSSHEADDFSEHDLDRWRKQLKDLQSEIISPSSAKLVPDKSAPIYMMLLKIDEPHQDQSGNNDEPPPTTNSFITDLQERFLQTMGPVSLEEGGYLAKYVGTHSDYAYIRGRFLYSKGCYPIRFKIEQAQEPYRIFFGCMSSQEPLRENAFRSKHAVGWFGFNQVYENGRCDTNFKKYGYASAKIKPNDILHLILDCDKKEIRLFHEREKTTCVISINDDFVPFPWQYLMVLCNPGDSVRILLNP